MDQKGTQKGSKRGPQRNQVPKGTKLTDLEASGYPLETPEIVPTFQKGSFYRRKNTIHEKTQKNAKIEGCKPHTDKNSD